MTYGHNENYSCTESCQAIAWQNMGKVNEWSLIQEAERNKKKEGGIWTLLRSLFKIITFHMSCVVSENG